MITERVVDTAAPGPLPVLWRGLSAIVLSFGLVASVGMLVALPSEPDMARLAGVVLLARVLVGILGGGASASIGSRRAARVIESRADGHG